MLAPAWHLGRAAQAGTTHPCRRLPALRIQRAVGHRLLERSDTELEQVPQTVRGPGIEQQTPARRIGTIERREEERAIDRRLKDEASLDERLVSEAPDALADEELVEPL